MPSPQGTATPDTAEWEIVAAQREAHIQKLLDENKQLQEDVLNWKLAVRDYSALSTRALTYENRAAGPIANRTSRCGKRLVQGVDETCIPA